MTQATSTEMQRCVYLISGPMASGKSTVARLLAARFDHGVHLEGDVFRRSIVSGRAGMTPDPSPEALAQLRLRYGLAAAATDRYFEAGFGVVVEDVVAGSMLGDYRTMIRSRPCHVVVLLPSVEAIAARESSRARRGYGAWTVERLHEHFGRETLRVGLWLDTTDLTPDETVDEIIAHTDSTRFPIVVTDYDPTWPRRFEEIAGRVRDALADLGATVEHVGSTSVPGLSAKPVIDIDVVVPWAVDVPAAVERLRSLGYTYQGDKGIRGREAFTWPERAQPHHLYVVVQGSGPYLDHVEFRDYLRGHPAAAREYAALKIELADRYGDDRAGYTDAKAEFVSGILRAARS